MSSRSIRDERWFEALFRTHHGAVLAYAARRVDDPDDVVSEVFAAAWRNRVKVPDTPLPWLLRTAGNVVLHAQRSHGRRLRLLTRTASLAGPESVGPVLEAAAGSSTGPSSRPPRPPVRRPDHDARRLAAAPRRQPGDDPGVMARGPNP